MKTEELERMILLAESGELPARDAQRLEDALREHPEGARLSRETRVLRQLASRALPDDGPGDFVLARIHDEAERALAARAEPMARRIVFPVLARRLAFAASALLVASFAIYTSMGPGRSVDPAAPLEVAAAVDVESMSAVIAMVGSDADGEELMPEAQAVDEEAQLRVLAQQILKLQGVNVSAELFEADETWGPDLTRTGRGDEAALGA